MPNHSLIEADRKHLIHPVISYRAHEARGVTVLESARGAFLRDADPWGFILFARNVDSPDQLRRLTGDR